jgi:polysaccharide biosynthesis/export protein
MYFSFADFYSQRPSINRAKLRIAAFARFSAPGFAYCNRLALQNDNMAFAICESSLSSADQHRNSLTKICQIRDWHGLCKYPDETECNMTFKHIIAALSATATLSACATMPVPTNLSGAQYQPKQQLGRDSAFNGHCVAASLPLSLTQLERVEAAQFAAMPDILAPGDRMKLTVSGDSGTLTGNYVVAANGQLMIGDRITMTVAGQSRSATQTALRNTLIRNGFVRDIPGNVRLQLEVAGSVAVSVEGAVFEAGRVRAGERGSEQNAAVLSNAAGGDFNAGRTLSTALRAAGGIRPDAAASAVYLVRDSSYAAIDLSPHFGGSVVVDPQLAAGDRIIVPTTGCFDESLVRPSSVTSPGVRVYMSNLSRPAASNASSAIGKDSTSLPYGTRLLQGLVSANCVGGSAMNAGRSAVLISRNPVNGQSVVIKRSIEQLVRNADRDALNPYLMPNDAIACYDSAAMTLVDVLGVFGNVLGPAALIKGIRN